MQTKGLPVCNWGRFESTYTHFWLQSISAGHCEIQSLQTSDKSPVYVLIVCTDGRGKITTQNGDLELNGVEVVFINPGCSGKIIFCENVNGTLIVFDEKFFSQRYSRNVLEQFDFVGKELLSVARLKNSQIVKFQALIQSMENHCTSQEFINDAILRGFLSALLEEFNILIAQNAVTGKHTSAIAKIKLFEKLIEQHFRNERIPTFYAEKMNITGNYLNKLCKSFYGTTASEFIRTRTVHEAKQLLKNSTVSIAEIGFSLGFENASHFVSFFKKQVKLSPEKFRKNQISQYPTTNNAI